MGSGVARQCSGNRCLARWTVGIPIVAAEAEQVERNSKKDLVTGQIRGSCALQEASSASGIGLTPGAFDMAGLVRGSTERVATRTPTFGHATPNGRVPARLRRSRSTVAFGAAACGSQDGI
jgi:hypothetical protein